MSVARKAVDRGDLEETGRTTVAIPGFIRGLEVPAGLGSHEDCLGRDAHSTCNNLNILNDHAPRPRRPKREFGARRTECEFLASKSRTCPDGSWALIEHEKRFEWERIEEFWHRTDGVARAQTFTCVHRDLESSIGVNNESKTKGQGGDARISDAWALVSWRLKPSTVLRIRGVGDLKTVDISFIAACDDSDPESQCKMSERQRARLRSQQKTTWYVHRMLRRCKVPLRSSLLPLIHQLLGGKSTALELEPVQNCTERSIVYVGDRGPAQSVGFGGEVDGMGMKQRMQSGIRAIDSR
ncbi:hypothetical protein FB451DRAFT_1194933 [Mycena latifolia]|nr:hypothetical protein FB451DRAFT_1194933 [Mycena latifolia]